MSDEEVEEFVDDLVGNNEINSIYLINDMGKAALHSCFKIGTIKKLEGKLQNVDTLFQSIPLLCLVS